MSKSTLFFIIGSVLLSACKKDVEVRYLLYNKTNQTIVISSRQFSTASAAGFPNYVPPQAMRNIDIERVSKFNGNCDYNSAIFQIGVEFDSLYFGPSYLRDSLIWKYSFEKKKGSGISEQHLCICEFEL